jgi:hypothetical protein
MTWTNLKNVAMGVFNIEQLFSLGTKHSQHQSKWESKRVLGRIYFWLSLQGSVIRRIPPWSRSIYRCPTVPSRFLLFSSLSFFHHSSTYHRSTYTDLCPLQSLLSHRRHHCINLRVREGIILEAE